LSLKGHKTVKFTDTSGQGWLSLDEEMKKEGSGKNRMKELVMGLDRAHHID